MRALAILTAVIGEACGNQFYISPLGNDSNNGSSPESAWKTLSRVNKQRLEPGDTVHLDGGHEFEGNLVFDSSDSGHPSNPLTVTSYGQGRATIRVAQGDGVFAENRSGIHLKNLTIRGPGRTDTDGGHGIHFVASSVNGEKYAGILFDNLDVSGFSKNGIFIKSNHASDPGFSDLSLSHCEIHDNGLNGVETAGVFRRGSTPNFAHKNVTVRDCSFHHNTGTPGLPSHSGSGIVLAFVDGALIEYCEAHHNGGLNNAPGGGPVGIWGWEVNNLVIQFCESHHNESQGGDGGGFDIDGGATNCVMQYNYAHDNAGAGFGIFQFHDAHPFRNNVVRYNISQNDGQRRGGGIGFWANASNGGINDTRIYNNTVYVGATQNGAGIDDTLDYEGQTHMRNVQVFNNILVTAPGKKAINIPIPGDAWTFRGNCYYTYGGPIQIAWGTDTFSSLDAWRTSTGHERDSGLELDPRLIQPGVGPTIGDPRKLPTLTAYKLKSGSPVIGKGLDLKTLFGIDVGARDYYGGPIPAGNGFSIGAHESP
ncbi:MAG: right-handed parallel beta-helix repeat-containing protein [Candidatus Hydrogenedentes bacterium]|nr:right-handed parallel beta-helix repeat-containing protein [Candidatus Hydrogenedentota bacterium]